MGRVLLRPAARRDLVQHFAYIGENAGLNAAHRFISLARRTFGDLALSPGVGVPGKVRKLPNLRMWRIRDFEKYLIFYHSVEDNIHIERVIHAARDYNRVLDSDRANLP